MFRFVSHEIEAIKIKLTRSGVTMKKLIVVLLCTASCVRSLHLRPDVSVHIPRTLVGVRVAILPVKNTQKTGDLVGRHRDGWGRFVQWRWHADPSVETVAQHMLMNASSLAGAISSNQEEATLSLLLEVTEADVTDDEILAGQETFGRASVTLHVIDSGGKTIQIERSAIDFSHSREQDPGLLGDALYESIAQCLARVNSAEAKALSEVSLKEN
jgi:hypothetical protein